MEKIINRVAQSSLLSIDLESYHDSTPRIALDIKPYLYEGIILKEMEFRQQLKNLDLNLYSGKYVAVYCSADAIIPTWAYMLMAVRLSPVCKMVVLGDLQKLEETIWNNIIDHLDLSSYAGAKVVIKGCSKVQIPEYAYFKLTSALLPFVSSIMYGEPCSTVPVYKKPSGS